MNKLNKWKINKKELVQCSTTGLFLVNLMFHLHLNEECLFLRWQDFTSSRMCYRDLKIIGHFFQWGHIIIPVLFWDFYSSCIRSRTNVFNSALNKMQKVATHTRFVLIINKQNPNLQKLNVERRNSVIKVKQMWKLNMDWTKRIRGYRCHMAQSFEGVREEETTDIRECNEKSFHPGLMLGTYSCSCQAGVSSKELYDNGWQQVIIYHPFTAPRFRIMMGIRE